MKLRFTMVKRKIIGGIGNKMTKIEELEVELKGRVQGVNFRWMTKRFADKLGLKGYVMNKEDGSVFLTVQRITSPSSGNPFFL